MQNETNFDEIKDAVDEIELGKLVEKISINVAGSVYHSVNEVYLKHHNDIPNDETISEAVITFSEELALKLLKRRQETYSNVRSKHLD